MEWIDINVDQPKADTKVIVCVDDDVFLDVFRIEVEISFFDSEVCSQGEVEPNITHWIPLPEPFGHA